MEKERLEKKLKALSNIKPAYVEEMERQEKELERLFQLYLSKQRNLDYLENKFDQIHFEEKEKKQQVRHYLEKM